MDVRTYQDVMRSVSAEKRMEVFDVDIRGAECVMSVDELIHDNVLNIFVTMMLSIRQYMFYNDEPTSSGVYYESESGCGEHNPSALQDEFDNMASNQTTYTISPFHITYTQLVSKMEKCIRKGCVFGVYPYNNEFVILVKHLTYPHTCVAVCKPVLLSKYCVCFHIRGAQEIGEKECASLLKSYCDTYDDYHREYVKVEEGIWKCMVRFYTTLFL
jgi:hypothetical protein